YRDENDRATVHSTLADMVADTLTAASPVAAPPVPEAHLHSRLAVARGRSTNRARHRCPETIAKWRRIGGEVGNSHSECKTIECSKAVGTQVVKPSSCPNLSYSK